MKFNATKHRNIIFDLGGVLLNLDYNRTTEALKQICGTFHSIDAVYTNDSNKKLFENFETGHISSDEFRNGIREIAAKLDLSNTEVDRAWNAMLLDFPKERIELLTKLSRQHKIYLLSNSNEIHINHYLKNLEKQHSVKDLSHIFIKEYYSFKIGLRKPNKSIYQYVLNENRLKPEETFFIDDSEPNILGAKSLGIDAYLLKEGETIPDVFKE